MPKVTAGRRPARLRRVGVVVALCGATALLGCEGAGDDLAPSSYRVTAAGTGEVNAQPVARLVPGTRVFSGTQSISWAVGAVRPDGTTHVAFNHSTLVLRESDRGVEFLGEFAGSETSSRAALGTSGLAIETQRPVTDAEVIVPRALRVGMQWRTGRDERAAYTATAVDTIATPVGPRRLWTVSGPSRVFMVLEGVGPIGVQQTFRVADLALDVVAAPDAPPPTPPSLPAVTPRLLPLDAAATGAASWFDPRAMQANALSDGSLLLQVAGSSRDGRGALDGRREGECFALRGGTVGLGELEVRPFAAGVRVERASPRRCRFVSRNLNAGSPSMGVAPVYSLATDGSGTHLLDDDNAWIVPRDGRGLALNGDALSFVDANGEGRAVTYAVRPTPNARLFTWTRERGFFAGDTWLTPDPRRSGSEPLSAWWVDVRGNVLRTAVTSGALSPAEPAAFAPGAASLVASAQGHEMLTTTGDGLVTRFVATPGAERFEALARVTLPPLHVLVGAVRHPGAPGRLVLAVADRTRRQVRGGAIGGMSVLSNGTLRFYEADVTASPVEAPSPPGLSLSAVPRGADLVVCGPPRAGELSTTAAWTLGGRPARAVAGPGSCVFVLRPLEATAAELTAADAWHVRGVLPGVGAFEMGMTDVRYPGDDHRVEVAVGTPIAGGFMEGLSARSLEGIPLRETANNPTLGQTSLALDDRGVVWGMPAAEEGFILRADLAGVRRWSVAGGAPRFIGPVMGGGGGVVVHLLPGAPGQGRIVSDDGVVGPVIDRAAVVGDFYWPDGHKCRVASDRLACWASGATTPQVVMAGERLPRFARSWGPGRALLVGDGLPTFVYDRAAGTVRRLDERVFVPARAPDGEIYGVLQRRDPTQRTEVVRLDEGGFVALPLPRPAWLPALAEPEAVSVGDERLAAVWGAATTRALVVYDRSR
jgi:hypothetical protein